MFAKVLEVVYLLIRQTAWTLFGICSVATGTWTFGGSPVLAEAPMKKPDSGRVDANRISAVAETVSHGKKVIKGYSVIGKCFGSLLYKSYNKSI